MSNSKPISNMDHTHDGLYQEIENIEKVINLDENKRQNIVDLKEEIKNVQNTDENSDCPFISGNMSNMPNPEKKLRENVIDEVKIMNMDQLAETHKFLKCNDIENVDWKKKVE